MSYDSDESSPGSLAPKISPPSNPRDLSTLVTVLELAAIELTKKEGDEFTLEELIRVAKDIAGPECPVTDADLTIVADGSRSLRKRRGKYQLK